jgi:hypothetical protein
MKREIINSRIRPDLKKRIEDRARKNNKTISSEIEYIIEEMLN